MRRWGTSWKGWLPMAASTADTARRNGHHAIADRIDRALARRSRRAAAWSRFVALRDGHASTLTRVARDGELGT